MGVCGLLFCVKRRKSKGYIFEIRSASGVLMSRSNKQFLTQLRSFSILTALLLACCSAVMAQKVRLRSQITPACTSTAGANAKFADIYADGNIAVQGSYGCKGAFIYDLTNPDAPVLASWYNPSPNQQFLEAIVVGNRGYFGSGGPSAVGEGVHIVDLSNPYNPVLLGKVNAASGGGHNVIHEMMVWGDYLIENYNSTGVDDLRIINISNPAAPVFKWVVAPNDPIWVHAMHIRGNRMYTSGWGGQIEIYDLTNIANQAPVRIGTIGGNNNNHSAWTSEDGNYLYSCRELLDGDVRVYDVRDASQPLLVRSIRAGELGINAVAPHNPVVMGNYLYVSWYQAGVQIFDISNPTNPVRVGQYDTFQLAFNPPAEESPAALESEPWDMVCGSLSRQNALPSSYDGNWAVHPFLGQNKVLAGDLKYGLLVLDASAVAAPPKNLVSDFDGDRRTDLSVFTPSSSLWSIENSSNGANTSTAFGFSDDKLVAGDYDGDGVSDIAIYRPSTGTWWIRRSTDLNNFQAVRFGLATDIPVAGDYDADGRTDLAVWRPSTGVWYIQQSTLGFTARQWGLSTDKPVAGDFEGDGKTDIAVWRPSNGVWYVLQSSSSIPMYRAFGTNGDKPVSADFDGNGITDFAVYRPSTGIWYILDPLTQAFSAYYFGLAEDLPIPADYDGDAKADVAVFRPSTNVWYRLNSSNGAFFARVFGQAGDTPSPSSVQPQ